MKLTHKIFIGIIAYAILLLFLTVFLNDLVALDMYLFLTINQISSPILDYVFIFITYAGESLFWGFIIIVLWLKKERKASVYLIYAFILDSILAFSTKLFFQRPRPPERFPGLEVLRKEYGLSFPSAHSERVFSGAVILGSLYKKFRLSLFVLAMIVAFSRIYIGVHYPSDVVIGSINGIIIGLISLAIPTKKLQKKLEKIIKI